MTKESNRCVSCGLTGQLLTCPFCEQKFCNDCYYAHISWERRHEDVQIKDSALGVSTSRIGSFSMGERSYTAPRPRRGGRFYWKIRCDICGRISLKLRECPFCMKRVCEDEFEAHISEERKTARRVTR